MSNKVLQIGAEAQILQHGSNVIKQRLKKGYRLPELDERIRKLRTRSEAKLLEKASKVINTPHLISVNEEKKEIIMDLISGERLSESLNSFPLDKQEAISHAVGAEIGKLHDAEIIHGDLTTSNMILVTDSKLLKKRKDISDAFYIFFIDFGLGYISQKVEDKAVDLHLLKQALEAKHFEHFDVLFKKVLKGYSYSKHAKKVLEQFKKVEARGRYKDNY